MAAQGLLSRAPCIFSSRFLLNNRLPQFTQTFGVKQKTLKDLKLPEKPKRPLSPFFRFTQEQRKSLVREHPDWKVTQISVQCAADWKKIDPTIKEKYENEYKTEMEKYAQEYTQYTNRLTEEQKEALSEASKESRKLKLLREKRKKIRELDKPKRPMGAYMMFVLEQAKSHPGKTLVDLMAKLKDEWAQLSPGDRAKYTLPVAQAQEKYERELKQWELQMMKDGNTDVVRKTTLALAGKPKSVSQKSDKGKDEKS